MTLYGFLNGDFLSTRRRRVTVFIATVTLLLAADALIKRWAESRLIEPYQPTLHAGKTDALRMYPGERRIWVDREIKVLGDYFTFTYVRNYNIGFSALTFLERFFSHETLALIMKSLQLGATLLVAAYFFWSGLRWWVPFTLVIAGGIGNAVDRLSRGYVIDFVKWAIPGSGIPFLDPFPVWNFADACITMALFSFLVLFFIEPRQKKPAGA